MSRYCIAAPVHTLNRMCVCCKRARARLREQGHSDRTQQVSAIWSVQIGRGAQREHGGPFLHYSVSGIFGNTVVTYMYIAPLSSLPAFINWLFVLIRRTEREIVRILIISYKSHHLSGRCNATVKVYCASKPL